MVKYLGEKTADILLSTLVGVLGFIILRNFDHSERLRQLESVIVKESRITRLEGEFDSARAELRAEIRGVDDRVRLLVDEMLRMRQGVNEMLLPVFEHVTDKALEEEQNENTSSNFDVDPLPSGGPE